jgi:hypothetical protein
VLRHMYVAAAGPEDGGAGAGARGLGRRGTFTANMYIVAYWPAICVEHTDRPYRALTLVIFAFLGLYGRDCVDEQVQSL